LFLSACHNYHLNSTRGALFGLILGLSFVVGCEPSLPSVGSTPTIPDPFSSSCLVEVTEELGLKFHHDPGAFDTFLMPQLVGAGGAMFDMDNDQDLDILLITGVQIGDRSESKGDRLFRQESDGKFTDVTDWSGIACDGFGMGCAVGDIDNDGDLDLYLTRYGEDHLLRNKGNGQFEDITQQSGIANPQWGTAACFADLDRDGFLDLFVANYGDYFPGALCEDSSGRRDFCGPAALSGTVSKLYRNCGIQGEGDTACTKFEDVSIVSGIAQRTGKGLGVLCKDFTDDGRMDIFVANDGEENFLWVQHDNFTFNNEAILRGLALNRFGEAQANMGVVTDDFNHDGWADIVVTHLIGEYNTLFSGGPHGQFTDQTAEAGMSNSSLPFTGFGIASADLDLDGDFDLAIANGGVLRSADAHSKDVVPFWQGYAQRNEIYLNDGKGAFASHSRLGGSDFATRLEVSRGIIAGDIDNDGDIDLMVTNCDGPGRLYRNQFPRKGGFLSVSVFDPKLKRLSIGATVQLHLMDQVVSRDLMPSYGYLTSNDFRVHFGVGDAKKYDSIRVTWPDNKCETEEFPGGPVDRMITLERGSGRILPGVSP
jgi:enediyne biosynthesis protein E4